MVKKFVSMPPYNPFYTQNESSCQPQSPNKLSNLKDKLGDLYK